MLLRKCVSCSEYCISPECPKCGGKTRNPHPPKFSASDKYGKYRRMAKQGAKAQY